MVANTNSNGNENIVTYTVLAAEFWSNDPELIGKIVSDKIEFD